MKTFYPTVPYKKMNDGVPAPAYAKPGDAGMDLCATEDVMIWPGEWKKVGSGIAVAIPRGFVGLVVPRSGLGCKGLVLKNGIGVIDSGYRGEIGLTLYNNNPQLIPAKRRLLKRRPLKLVPNDEPIAVHKGDRVAQLLIVSVAEAIMAEVSELDETERGASGFGSSGVRL